MLQHIFLAMSYVILIALPLNHFSKKQTKKKPKKQKPPKKTKIPLAFLSASLIELCYSIMKQWFSLPNFYHFVFRIILKSKLADY